ncbi:hypothetical protein PR002_g17299 [Phytophthora rubi]|uniref:Uncharacterized protein n=1 Tax=Phytophthora rubi TaxID=129364 RepID=A0A6A3KIJ6_9STRA|nr:hypothetical protein PR002_g17299 [Phytophthora rubi]
MVACKSSKYHTQNLVVRVDKMFARKEAPVPRPRTS